PTPPSRTPRLRQLPAPTEICTRSLHDALPICLNRAAYRAQGAVLDLRVFRLRRFPALFLPESVHLLLDGGVEVHRQDDGGGSVEDRKSTRLNSSHVKISYAVFCLTTQTNRTDR